MNCKVLCRTSCALLLASACGDDTDALGNGDGEPMDMGAPNHDGGPSLPDGGPAAELSISTLNVDFGEIVVGQASDERVVLIENVGSRAVDVLEADRGPLFEDAFSFSLDDQALQPGATTQLRLLFSPIATGVLSSDVILSATVGGLTSETRIELVGAAVSVPVTVTPTSLDFGNAVLGTTVVRTVEVANQGTSQTVIDFIEGQNIGSCDQGAPGAFCIQPPTDDFEDDESFPLGAGEARALSLEFTPGVQDSQEMGTFSLRYCPEAACTVDVQLAGFGIATGLVCMPTNLDFGAVATGSCREELIICENVGNEQETILSSRTTDQTSNEFVVPVMVPSQLPPSAPGQPPSTVEVPLEYCPADAGADSGEFEIVVGDANEQQAITIAIQGESL